MSQLGPKVTGGQRGRLAVQPRRLCGNEGVNGLDIGRRDERSEPWSPEPPVFTLEKSLNRWDCRRFARKINGIKTRLDPMISVYFRGRRQKFGAGLG